MTIRWGSDRRAIGRILPCFSYRFSIAVEAKTTSGRSPLAMHVTSLARIGRMLHTSGLSERFTRRWAQPNEVRPDPIWCRARCLVCPVRQQPRWFRGRKLDSGDRFMGHGSVGRRLQAACVELRSLTPGRRLQCNERIAMPYLASAPGGAGCGSCADFAAKNPLVRDALCSNGLEAKRPLSSSTRCAPDVVE